jgi:hypothetical protein
MANPGACNVLRQVGSDRLVLCADYAATGRPTATFYELVQLLKAEFDIWETVPAPYRQDVRMSGMEQLDRWERDIRAAGLPVHAVLGFCAGNVYAGLLAERIAVWQDAPRLILLDPGRARRQMLVEHVEGLLSRLASTFDPAVLEEARQMVRDADADVADPMDLAHKLAPFCLEVVTPALRRAFHSAQASEQFTKIISGYLCWLGGAAQLDPRGAWAAATALNSNSTNYGLFLTPESEREALVATATYYDVSHGDLMRTPAVAVAVDELLCAEVALEGPTGKAVR